MLNSLSVDKQILGTIHTSNLQYLAAEVFKVKIGISPAIRTEILNSVPMQLTILDMVKFQNGDVIELHAFFVSNAFFHSASVLLNFFHELNFKCCLGVP